MLFTFLNNFKIEYSYHFELLLLLFAYYQSYFQYLIIKIYLEIHLSKFLIKNAEMSP